MLGVAGVLAEVAPGPGQEFPVGRGLLAGEVPFPQSATDPHVNGECLQLFQGKDGDAVGDLGADAVAFHQAFLGIQIWLADQVVQVQGAIYHFSGGPVHVGGAKAQPQPAQLHFTGFHQFDRSGKGVAHQAVQFNGAAKGVGHVFHDLVDALNVGVGRADVGYQAFPWFLAQNAQAWILVHHGRHPPVVADFFLDMGQVVVQPEVVLEDGDAGGFGPGGGVKFNAVWARLPQAKEVAPHYAGEPGVFLSSLHSPTVGLSSQEAGFQIKGMVNDQFHGPPLLSTGQPGIPGWRGCWVSGCRAGWTGGRPARSCARLPACPGRL